MQPKSMTTSSAGSTAPVARAGVRLRPVGAGRDDRVEAVAARAPAAHLDLEVEREVAFGRPLGEAREQRGRRVVGDRAGGADPGDLGRLLDPAQPLDDAVGRDELGARRARRRTRAAGPRSRAWASRPTRAAGRRARRRARRAGRRRWRRSRCGRRRRRRASCSPAWVRYRPSEMNTNASSVTSSIAELPVKPVR